jgi:hypothetical protein
MTAHKETLDMVYKKLDNKHTVEIDPSPHSHGTPYFVVSKRESWFCELEKRELNEKPVYIRLDKPEYYECDYTFRLSKEVIKKLAKAMSREVNIRDGDVCLNAPLWNICVWFWNHGNDGGDKLRNYIKLRPNYLELPCED